MPSSSPVRLRELLTCALRSPVMGLSYLPRRSREQVKRFDEGGMPVAWDAAEQGDDLPPSVGSDGVDEALARRRETEHDLPAITSADATADEALADEAVAHPRRSRRRNPKRGRKRGRRLRPARREHDEQAILRQRDILVAVGERAGRERDERPARRDSGLYDRLSLTILLGLPQAPIIELLLTLIPRLPAETLRAPQIAVSLPARSVHKLNIIEGKHVGGVRHAETAPAGAVRRARVAAACQRDLA